MTYTSNAAMQVDNLRDEYGRPGSTVSGRPKFKMGDRVHYRDSECAGVGIVTHCDDYDGYYVRLDRRHAQHAIFNADGTLRDEAIGVGGAESRYFDPISLSHATSNDNTPSPTTGFTVPLCAYEPTITTTALGDAYVAGYKAGLAAATAKAA